MTVPTETHEVRVHLSREAWNAFVTAATHVDLSPADAFDRAIDELGLIVAQEQLELGEVPLIARRFFLDPERIAKLHVAALDAGIGEHSAALATIQQFVDRRGVG